MIYILVLIQIRAGGGGVMVLMNNNFEQKVKRVKTDKNGNFILLDMVAQDKNSL